MAKIWNPLTGRFDDDTPITTDNKTTPYQNEPILTAPPMRCTQCGRVTTELHTNFTYPEEHLCPECDWMKRRYEVTFIEPKANRTLRKLKKWLKKQYRKWPRNMFYEECLDKIKELEAEK